MAGPVEEFAGQARCGYGSPADEQPHAGRTGAGPQEMERGQVYGSEGA